MRIATVVLLAASCLAATACTKAETAKREAYGTPARIVCLSGGKPYLDDMSTGKILSEGQSDGYYYQSKTTGRLIEVSGECVIDHRIDLPRDWHPIMP